MTMLQLREISKAFGQTHAVQNVSLDVPAGSRTVIVGPSASGKTTLLRIIAGFEMPDDGIVTLDGVKLADARRSVPAYKRQIGYVAQDGALFPHLNVADNIGFGLSANPADKARTVGELLELVDLSSSLLGRRPDQLSGGQQQRVALARALAQKPRLILLDEPFSSLDQGLRQSTRQAVAKVLGEAGMTTIMITHDQNEALLFGDQLAVLSKGRLLQTGSPRELYLHPKSVEVARYLGDAIILPANIEGKWAQCALGQLPVDGGAVGAATIMLRPEQLRVTPGPVASASNGATATVAAVEFGGATCTIILDPHTIDSRPSRTAHLIENPSIRAHVTPFSLPDVGATVNLTIDGEAHILDSIA